MQQSKVFGRRVPASAAPRPPAPQSRAELLAGIREPAPVQRSEDAAVWPPAHEPPSLEQELKEWKEARRRHKRSFREPWRSVSIVAGLGFAATSWIVPDSVADVTELALGVLTVGSFYAGWRGRKTTQPSRTAEPHS